jgi:hypothetical protein
MGVLPAASLTGLCFQVEPESLAPSQEAQPTTSEPAPGDWSERSKTSLKP